MLTYREIEVFVKIDRFQAARSPQRRGGGGLSDPLWEIYGDMELTPGDDRNLNGVQYHRVHL